MRFETKEEFAHNRFVQDGAYAFSGRDTPVVPCSSSIISVIKTVPNSRFSPPGTNTLINYYRRDCHCLNCQFLLDTQFLNLT